MIVLTSLQCTYMISLPVQTRISNEFQLKPQRTLVRANRREPDAPQISDLANHARRQMKPRPEGWLMSRRGSQDKACDK